VQAIEARVCSVEAAQKRPNFKVVERPPVYWNEDADLATILGKRTGETIEDAARRVCASFEATLTRLTKERDNAVRELPEAIKGLHTLLFGWYGGNRVGPHIDCYLKYFQLLARHGLATDHDDGTFHLKELK
jgi:hypothetical protein